MIPKIPARRPSGAMLIFTGVLIVVVVITFSFQGGKAASMTALVPANVSIIAYMSLGLSSNMSAGVLFGSLSPNTEDNNATENHAALGNSTYYLYASDTNTNVDFCISDSTHLTSSGGHAIGNGNYTLNDSLIQNGPFLPGVAISTTYQKLSQQTVPENIFVYLRFWLDVPASQPAGTYNNTLSFKVVEGGQSC